MASIRLQPETLTVESFDIGGSALQPSYALIASDPIETDPNTWEDTCIKMCPTDDTCTRLGCTREAQ
ncbi:MAG TPA: hypothetical protein VFJ16_28655 [Longimicrobium sp.]|nr:hypothetical protein [Longimicrobium sp.]